MLLINLFKLNKINKGYRNLSKKLFLSFFGKLFSQYFPLSDVMHQKIRKFVVQFLNIVILLLKGFNKIRR